MIQRREQLVSQPPSRGLSVSTRVLECVGSDTAADSQWNSTDSPHSNCVPKQLERFVCHAEADSAAHPVLTIGVRGAPALE